jgi:hypothetical protein
VHPTIPGGREHPTNRKRRFQRRRTTRRTTGRTAPKGPGMKMRVPVHPAPGHQVPGHRVPEVPPLMPLVGRDPARAAEVGPARVRAAIVGLARVRAVVTRLVVLAPTPQVLGPTGAVMVRGMTKAAEKVVAGLATVATRGVEREMTLDRLSPLRWRMTRTEVRVLPGARRPVPV